MYREGHVGAALLVYTPVGMALAMDGQEELAIGGAVMMALLAMVPDWDERIPGMSHRGFTHTLGFAFVLGAILWVVGGTISSLLGNPDGIALADFGFLLGFLSGIVHLATDALTPEGVRPFWPLSTRVLSLSLMRAGDPVANYSLFALGVLSSSIGLLVVAG